MNRTFHSKVDMWYWLLIAFTAFLLFDFFWFHYTLATFLAAVVMIFEIEMLIHTKYVVTADKKLLIESGRFVPNRIIPLSDILSMNEVKSFSIAPALSCHRIEICYRSGSKQEKVWISPQYIPDFKQWIQKKQKQQEEPV